MNNNRSDLAEVIAQSEWSEEGSYLGELVKTSGFPILLKVIRGQYQNIGTPSFSNPSLVSYVLLISVGKVSSIAAQCVKLRNNHKHSAIPYGPTLTIPETYQGHFEILSEDGKCVPCLQTVEELIKTFPDACLIREPIKAHKPKLVDHSAKAKSGVPGISIRDDFLKISEKTKTLLPGEVLVLIGEVNVPSGKNKFAKYLKCFDSKGHPIYLNSTQKGKFSPIAAHEDETISGVHTARNILKKRMPMMVRLVDGKPPHIPALSKTFSSKFVPELRLFTTIKEELVFGMPLSQNSKEKVYSSGTSILALPLSAPLKFQICRNMSQIEQMKEFSRLHECLKLFGSTAKNLIQVYDTNLKKDLRFDGRQWKSYTPPIPFFRTIQASENPSQIGTRNSRISHTYNEIPDATDYEDIDQIYDYVRGFKPSQKASANLGAVLNRHENTSVIPVHKKSLQSKFTESVQVGIGNPGKKDMNFTVVSIQNKITKQFHRADEQKPPSPPPIETIPTHKNKNKHAQTCLKSSQDITMLISSGNSSNNTVASRTSDETISTTKSDETELIRKNKYVKRQINVENTGFGLSGSSSNRILFPRSPLFDFRYKSMNDLYRNSLDSNTSNSAKQIRYFNRHNYALFGQTSKLAVIYRPKSLTNLFDHHIMLPHTGAVNKKKLLEALDPRGQYSSSTIDLNQNFGRSSRIPERNCGRRKSCQPTLYL